MSIRVNATAIGQNHALLISDIAVHGKEIVLGCSIEGQLRGVACESVKISLLCGCYDVDLRAVATTLSPSFRHFFTSSKPNPVDVPVMKKTCGAMI